MTLAIIIFFAQAAMVFLLGFQSLSVTSRHYFLAALGSVFLGATGWQITAIIAQLSNEPPGSAVWWSYIVAGPVGITASIYLHPKLHRLLARKKPAMVPPLTKTDVISPLEII